ncbi:DUF4382 domain-containing protein [uncultured Kriegella sp.]|uniref:DUF4382 domain-containing protein n=1 Tax=uncultured Kriegella sp. TaxID=1798910 RepID=UPI0030DACC8E|tara:strand:- start:258522 stop:259475 length:954 start_codon:yes stop_codon:yes gene_type:complete
MKKYLKNGALLGLTMMAMIACSKSDDGEKNTDGESYNTTFKITDAPVDNANIEAVFVTISDVKVDGTSLEGFNTTTIELSALVNGKTETLGNLDLQAGSYSDIVLELDYDMDSFGNSPGCYVEMADGSKDKLEASSKKINISNAFEVFTSTSNEIIIDFDLRKAVKEEQGAVSSNFEFVSTSELSASIRTINEEFTGEISGTANDTNNTSDKVVVYCYEKGAFDAETETEGQGSSNVTFANAITSAEVSATNGSYSLNFLAEGEYELVFASYNKDGDAFYFNSLLEVESTTGLNLGAISVSAALQISANVTITGTKQ